MFMPRADHYLPDIMDRYAAFMSAVELARHYQTAAPEP
jgi:hypothetical protein